MNKLQTNWYKELLEDLKKLEFTGIVLTKWNIGKRILEEEKNPEYGDQTIKKLANDLGVRAGELWLCVQFYKKFDDVKLLKEKSWHYITHELLPEPRKEKTKTPPLPEGKFNVIYADPPWEYSNSGFEMSAEKQYPTMPTEDICKMEIPSTPNSVLFLWATNPLLEDAFKVINSWGFEYKTNIVWVKKRHTAGFYVFGQHELLLIAVKGSMLPEKLHKSIIEGENKKHSKKPDKVYGIIESMYPKGKYLELFARNKKTGWTSWGNEI